MIPRRYFAEQGNSGSGDLRHGAHAPDMTIQVPVGTVIREISREGDEERHWHEEEEDGVDMEDRKWLRWERYFQVTSAKPFEEKYFKAAERLLRREKRWATRTPTFEEIPPVTYDLSKPTEKPLLLAKGGQGGFGNPFFAGVMGFRQPRIASRGLIPYTSVFEVELKILADVGLVGFPNAGKSTILRALTGRRAEVASYQFTTLNPQVGVVRVWDDGTWGSGGVSLVGDSGVVEDTWRERERDNASRAMGEYAPRPRTERVREARELDADVDGQRLEAYRFTISDNPGLLPQASENVGLGHSFLRSIERSKALAYVLDISRPEPEKDLIGLRNELEAYKAGLAANGAVVVLNKGDMADEAAGKEKVARVKEVIKDLEEDMSVVVLSGKFGLGLDKLVKGLGARVQAVRRAEEEKERAEDEAQFIV